jgi:transcriptional regulator with XRE-family HTH domain
MRTRVWELADRERWTLRQLSARMGVSHQHLSMVRRGRRGIGRDFISGARRAFPGYPLDWLFPEEPEAPRREAI